MRRIGVVTGSRAEYGLLKGLMRSIDQDSSLELVLMVTGMHLSPMHGETWRTIVDDGFTLHERIATDLSDDSPATVTRALGQGVIGFGEVFARNRPDILVVLGDRFEILAPVQAALLARIPVAHIHGGERTDGAVDDAIRHAITKFAHLHFVAAEPYRRRVIQLGEVPERVFTVGALGLDAIAATSPLTREQWQVDAGFELGEVNFLVTYHPATLGRVPPSEAAEALLGALDEFPQARVVITESNADVGGAMIVERLRAFARERPRVSVFTSLGSLRYYSLLQWVDVVIGNSSSGLIEVPWFGKPTVNIGERQAGRLRGDTVIDCADDQASIRAAITRALSTEFRRQAQMRSNPYGQGNAVERILDILRCVPLEGLTNKRFNDLEGVGA
ncbi:MAG: UDP-N-acetylglucosamine 2-epimerase (hydrolyzing) [Chromatiales bacterium]|nr:UDP-N-acetylglucosamine 2-epimerase (hydrolyzing) [Chromatiales bacterium]